MDEEEYSFVVSVVERTEALTRKSLGERIARHTAELAKREGLANNRRWLAEIDIYEEELRGFLVSCSAEIGRSVQGAEAFAILAERFEALRRDARQDFAKRFDNATRFTDPTAANVALPDARRDAEASLDIELKIQRQAFLNRQVDMPVQPSPKPIVPARNKGGKPLAAHWDSLWASIAVQLWNGSLNPKTQADIERAMHNWLTAKSIDAGETAVRQRARQLWQTMHPGA